MLHLTPIEKAFAAFRRKAGNALSSIRILLELTPEAREKFGAIYEADTRDQLQEAFHEWVEGGSLGRID